MQERLPERRKIVGMIVPADDFSEKAATEIVARGGKVFRPRVGGPAGIRYPDLTPRNTNLSSDSSPINKV